MTTHALPALAGRGQVQTLVLGTGEKILFYQGSPVAALAGSVCYFKEDIFGAALAQVHKLAATAEAPPLVRVGLAQFSFVLGACLTKAGLPLTHRLET